MIADSLGSLGAWPLSRIRWTWSLVMIPPMIVCLPVIIRGNQSPSAVMQFQRRIGQWIGNTVLSELRTNRTHNDSLWRVPFNNESANHHVVARLHKAARADVAQN